MGTVNDFARFVRYLARYKSQPKDFIRCTLLCHWSADQQTAIVRNDTCICGLISAIKQAESTVIIFFSLLRHAKGITSLALGTYTPTTNIETFVGVALMHHVALLVQIP